MVNDGKVIGYEENKVIEKADLGEVQLYIGCSRRLSVDLPGENKPAVLKYVKKDISCQS